MGRTSKVVFSDKAFGGTSDTYLSDDYVERDDYNAVMVEVWGSGECRVEIHDSWDGSAGYSAAVDQGQGLVLGTITANTKWYVSPVLDYIKAALTVYSGRWSIRLTACHVPTPQSIIPRTQQQAYGCAMAPLRNVRGTVQTVISAARTLYGMEIENDQGAVAYVQVFDAQAADVTLGTSWPRLEFRVDANARVSPALPAVGAWFQTAITVASTTTAGGSTGSAAGVHVFPMYG